MNITTLYTPFDLIILLGIMMIVAMFAMNLISTTRRDGTVDESLNNKDMQITHLSDELQALGETCRALKKEVDLRDLYKGETDRYLQAINAAKSGSSSLNLMEQFDLIEAEAELIISMHGNGEHVEEI